MSRSFRKTFVFLILSSLCSSSHGNRARSLQSRFVGIVPAPYLTAFFQMSIGSKQTEGAQSGRKGGTIRKIRSGDEGSQLAIEKRGSLSISLDGAGVHAYNPLLVLWWTQLCSAFQLGDEPFFFFIWSRPSRISTINLLLPRCTFSRRLPCAWTDSRIEEARARGRQANKQTTRTAQRSGAVVVPFPPFFFFFTSISSEKQLCQHHPFSQP